MEQLDRKILSEDQKEKRDRLEMNRDMEFKLDEEITNMRRKLARDRADKDLKLKNVNEWMAQL